MGIEKFYTKVWEEEVVIPTYPIGEADKNPMFLEKRVYQGSSGKVYPHAVIDKIYDNKIDKTYKAVYLENPYLKIMILPELGGRIQRAYDKTNDYDFVYYNEVIKPALVGLTGPWISGGIEFNWPQHHRPNTFGPVEYTLEENKDGSKTVWVSEIDRMYGTKGMAGFTLYEDKAYLEIKGQLYNRTEMPQTFLWWANPAVPVNDYTQSIFPPDVHAVLDHGKRDVSEFPIAKGTYYKMDYSKGVDISKYKNIPVPTSYMAYKSDYNFVGGYDYGKKAGILHVASNNISPGKKQWTWGCGDFGKAWDRNLTDNNGPYIELMTGVFTDNQPDFTWLQPFEEKNFKQYFMPYKDIEEIKNTNINVAVNLKVNDNKAYIGVYATGVYEDANIVLKADEKVLFEKLVTISPEATFESDIELSKVNENSEIKLIVLDNKGKELISYKKEEKEVESEIPEPAKEIKVPEELENNEALYLAGLHLEQYRHATYCPEDYYLEGLKRDSKDIRINNAYGKLILNRGDFKSAETYFRTAVESMSRHNSNPYDGESYYNLGVALKYENKLEEAYKNFYKSVWEYRYQAIGYYYIASIDCINIDYKLALEHIDESLIRNMHNMKARVLKSVILRKLGKYREAIKFCEESIDIDILDFGARYELAKESSKELEAFKRIMRDDPHNYITLANDYSCAGFYEEAINVLELFVSEVKENIYPMIHYYLAYYYNKISNKKESNKNYELAYKCNSKYCFPNTINDLLVLEEAIKENSKDSKALYYLGNLLYDKKRYEEAVELWEKSSILDSAFPTVFRNLSLAYYNKLHNEEKAKKALEIAFNLDKSDARVLLELDQLYKKLDISYKDRLNFLNKYIELVESRDDLYVEYLTLMNKNGDYKEVKELILNRKFHPWEGGEGKISKQYILSCVEISKENIKNNNFEKAIEELEDAKVYPQCLGEGKLQGAQENNINYYLGVAYEGLGDSEKAKDFYRKASIGLSEPTSAMYYNDQPPEMIYYQGLAMIKLGKKDMAENIFNKLITYGKEHMRDNVRIDYFAVSLPDFLIFDEDLNKRNRTHCNNLIKLGNRGHSISNNTK